MTTKRLAHLLILSVGLLLCAPAQADPATDHYNEGLRLKKAGKLDAAIVAMEEALKLRPDYAAVHQSMGVLQRKKKAYAKARAHLRNAIQLEAKWANAYYSLGLVLYHQGKKDEAVTAMEKAAALDPRDAMTLEQLGVMLGRKDPKKAVACLKKAVKLKPGDAKIRHKLGIAHRRAGQFKEAEAALLLAANSDLTASLAFDLGVMFRHKKEPRKAVLYYKKAIKLEPKLTDAHWDLAHMYELLGEKDKARQAYQLFLTLKARGKQADTARARLESLK